MATQLFQSLAWFFGSDSSALGFSDVAVSQMLACFAWHLCKLGCSGFTISSTLVGLTLGCFDSFPSALYGSGSLSHFWYAVFLFLWRGCWLKFPWLESSWLNLPWPPSSFDFGLGALDQTVHSIPFCYAVYGSNLHGPNCLGIPALSIFGFALWTRRFSCWFLRGSRFSAGPARHLNSFAQRFQSLAWLYRMGPLDSPIHARTLPCPWGVEVVAAWDDTGRPRSQEEALMVPHWARLPGMVCI